MLYCLLLVLLDDTYNNNDGNANNYKIVSVIERGIS